MKPAYTLLIPAFNEESAIGPVLDSLKDLEGCQEILVVDDGSTDRTAAEADRPGVRVIRHAYNRGYGASLKTGIMACNTEYVVLCDGDGQHRREDVQRVAAEAERFDMVVGSRQGAGRRDWMRMPGKAVLGWFANLLAERSIPDLNSGLRSFRVQVIRRYLHIMPQGFSFTTTSTLAMFSTGHTVHYLPIEVQARNGRKSTVRILRDGVRVLNLILNLTVLFNPMKVFAPLAIFFVGLSVVYFTAYSATIRVHVSPSMVLLFITGVILFFLGVISEQISALRRDLHRGD
jgi:glycosyltransferase involved in cell wall biosynthesis